MRFGLRNGGEPTLAEVAQSFAVTRERIRQIEAAALHKLREPSRSQTLRPFLQGTTSRRSSRRGEARPAGQRGSGRRFGYHTQTRYSAHISSESNPLAPFQLKGPLLPGERHGGRANGPIRVHHRARFQNLPRQDVVLDARQVRDTVSAWNRLRIVERYS